MTDFCERNKIFDNLFVYQLPNINGDRLSLRSYEIIENVRGEDKNDSVRKWNQVRKFSIGWKMLLFLSLTCPLEKLFLL